MAKAQALVYFIILAITITIIIGIVWFTMLSQNKQVLPEPSYDAAETSSFSTYVESSYELAAKCFLTQVGLADGEFCFSNARPNLVAGQDYIETVIDEVFQNFTVFIGRNITKGQVRSNFKLTKDAVELQIDQPFTIKVDNKAHKIGMFYTTFPIPLKSMISLRDSIVRGDDALESGDIDLTALRKQQFRINIYQNKGRTLIEQVDSPKGVYDEYGPYRYVFVT